MRSKNFLAQMSCNIVQSLKTASLLVAVIAVSAFAVSAQQMVWSENAQDRSSIVTDKAVARQSFPKEFKLYNLNVEPLRQQLFSIVGDNKARQQSVVISMPNADGDIEYFEVFEASNFEPELQARFPEIRAFSGQGITDRYATIKLSISPEGIQTMVFRTDKDNEFIEPYSQNHNVYAVFRTTREKGKMPWACSTEDKNFFSLWSSDLNLRLPDAPTSNVGQIKTMRLAQSCNGEYANYFGATSAAQVNLVLAAFNATLTRANGVYEKDLAIHLNLIPQTTAVIYYDPATDPYSTSISAWNAQLQTALTQNIGEANYDIGHMFGASGGGGNAGCIGCVCVDGQKGRGITSPADGIPQGDNFDIDYVVHEVGHQMGANHTFSYGNEGTGVNKEVGSGITIMGYAGITAYDVAPHSIDTFHEASIQQIQVNMANKTCPVTTTMTANQTPVVAAVPNYSIPISTPFALTGSATDANGDPLTYQWEQNDNSTTTGASSVASPTKLTGPNWLSFLPTTSPTRMFPRLSTILAGQFVTGPIQGGDAGANIEALSSVARTLNFRLTVRDNKPYAPGSTIGQTQFTDTVITVVNTGAFKVTTGNTATTFAGGANRTITWDVSGTTVAPISTANVKISLSTDGGNTFPTVLAESTPNDGSESVAIPNTATTTARIKIEAVGNIFFDINDANITIGAQGGPAQVSAGTISITSESCGIGNGQPDPGETLTVSLPISNTGGTATTNLTATLQATGGVQSAITQNYGAIAAGGSAVVRNFTFTVDPNLPCGSPVTLTFVVSDGSTTFPNITKTYSTGTATVSLTENFNGVTAPALPSGWASTQTSGTGITWVTSSTTPSSTPNAAYANEAATVSGAALVSPAVTVSSASAQLKFKNQYNTEATYDGTVLEYSTNGGTTWTDIVTGGGSFVSGGYTGAISTAYQSPIAGRQAWSGASTGYVDTVVNLPASLNGQSVRFRWLTASDSSEVATGTAGQWVDDVQVLGGVTCSCTAVPNTCAIQRKSDFNGDGLTDYGVFRPSTGAWYVQPNGAGSAYGVVFGQSGDKLQPADYDGDGKTDFGVFRSGAWYWINSSTNTVGSATWGASTDIPVAGDYLGSNTTTAGARAEVSVYRPSTGVWYAMNLADNTMAAVQWGGAASDIPVLGDFDGDCKMDFAVRRTTNQNGTNGTTFFIRQANGSALAYSWGREDMAMAIADYDGDGKSDIGVVNNSGGLLRWYVISTASAVLINGTQFGQSGDIVTVGNYDSDPKADLSIWRPSIGTFAYRSTVSGTEIQRIFGASTDIPTARANQYPLP